MPQAMPKEKQQNRSWFTLENVNDSSDPVKVWIHGSIGDWDIDAIDLIQALQSVSEQDVQLRVLSDGGSVYQGLGMYNAIKAHKGKTSAIVDGVAASIASYLIMACDEVQMPQNAKLMIHNPSMGAWGGESELESALTQLKNAKTTIAEGYADKSGLSLDDVLAAMVKETWYTAEQALEAGLIDKVVDAVDLTNCANTFKPDSFDKYQNTPSDLIAQLKPAPDNESEQEPEPEDPPPLAAKQQSEPSQSKLKSNDMPKLNDDNTLQNALKKENERQSAIRALCATHKVIDSLRDEMLNDLSCSADNAAAKILAQVGAESVAGKKTDTASNVTGAHLNPGNGNITKDTLQNALNARCGVDKLEKDNPYKLKTLLDMAEISVGKDARQCSTKSELVARAFNTGDFGEIITESIRTVMRDEAKIRAPLWRDLASTENLPNFKETELVMVNDAPDLMAVSEDGEYKQAIIKGTGEKIQLATFGREIAVTRHAIINDEISLLAKIPRKFMQSGYRLSDKLMFAAILAGQMGDGKSIFIKPTGSKWGNLADAITAGDYPALIMALHKSFATTVTSGGDALDLRGEVLLANPDHASYLEAVLNTASKPDTFNPAYKKFAKVVETARLADINGAIALTGKDFDSVLMGFLDGQQDPWLETGEGFSTDGAKFRITYDLTSKVVDRRGIAKAIFTG